MSDNHYTTIKTPKRAWHEDKEKLFRFRISQLSIGDALVCPDSKWRVDFLADGLDIVYLISNSIGEITRRKRPDSAAIFLANNTAPATLKHVEHGARFPESITDSLDSRIELLGYYPAVDVPTLTTTWRQSRYHAISELFGQASTLVNRISIISKSSHEAVRFVIQEYQMDCFGQFTRSGRRETDIAVLN